MLVGDLGIRESGPAARHLWLVGAPFCLPRLRSLAEPLGWTVHCAPGPEAVHPVEAGPTVVACTLGPHLERAHSALGQLGARLPELPVIGLAPAADASLPRQWRRGLFDLLAGEECTAESALDAVEHALWHAARRPRLRDDHHRDLRAARLLMRRQRVEMRRLRARQANLESALAQAQARASAQARARRELADRLARAEGHRARAYTGKQQLFRSLSDEVGAAVEEALRSLDTEEAEPAQLLVDTAHRLSTLAEDLAAAADILEPLELPTTGVEPVELAAGLRRALSEATDIDLRLRVHASVPPMRASGRALHQALLHLLACGVEPLVDGWLDLELDAPPGQVRLRLSPVRVLPEAWRSELLLGRLGATLVHEADAIALRLPAAVEEPVPPRPEPIRAVTNGRPPARPQPRAAEGQTPHRPDYVHP